jgi:regulator of protease activity HflC (stomatin/prohibitin superfamily)
MNQSKLNISISGPGVALAIAALIAGAAGIAFGGHPAYLIIAVIVAAFLLFSVKVAKQWEKVAVLRLGRFSGLRGPGLFFIVPIVDTLSRYVDQRVRVIGVTAESTLTRDTVPVNVDAIVFWLVWNAEKAIFEDADFPEAIKIS